MSEDVHQFQKLLSALMVISGTEGKTTALPDLATVLKYRLSKVDDILNQHVSQGLEDADLKKLQHITALESLRIVQELQDILDQEETQSSGPPLLGTRDLACVKTVLSIIIKWGVEPLLAELEVNIPRIQGPGVDRLSSIIDLTDRAVDFQRLPDVLIALMDLMFRRNTKIIRQSWITSSLLSNHAVDLLTPLLVLGWSSKPILGSSDQKQRFKEFSLRFISLLRTAEATSALGTILASAASKRHIYPHLSKACGFLLSKQLLRPDGVQGLYTAVFGEEQDDSESAPLDKLERTVKILTTVPAAMIPENYYTMIIPKILDLLSPKFVGKIPTMHKRASAFTLSRMLLKDFGHYQITSGIILPYFHRPFQQHSDVEGQLSEKLPTPQDSLLTLQAFLLNTDPSPEAISILLTPIIPELYSLHSAHVFSKTGDPSIRETLHGLLGTWSRVTASSEVIDGVWKIISGYGGDWDMSLEGFSRSTRNPSAPAISLQTVAQLDGKPEDEVDLDANPFNLRPDPVRFISFMKDMDRKDVSSEVLLRLLNGYQELKERDRDEDAIRNLLYLQLILQMQAQLSDAIVSKPEHVLSFIKHALDSLPRPSPLTKSSAKKGLSLKDLRIVQDIEEDKEADSDDEDVIDPASRDGNAGTGKDDMSTTAITLLLSILEGHPDLFPQTNPDLNDIAIVLEHVASNPASTPNLRQLAREARLVLLARSASTSAKGQVKSVTRTDQETANDIYQRALKLLQEPIIPVRAHGLQLLRDLLSKGSRDRPEEYRLDPALLPGILSIFLQSIQDQESYIFLNAVQGLAAMVDGYGRDVLKGIMDVYLQGTGIGRSGTLGSSDTMTKEELDARIRVGEALNNVVRRCGGALASYIDVLLPPLLAILQSAHLPTVLRVSALSILAQCAWTNVVSLNSYAARLLDTCVEIIRLEHVPMKFSQDKGKQASSNDVDEVTISARQSDHTDSDPTTSVTKAPSLRRSALHLLAQLFRAHILLRYDTSSRQPRQPTIGIRVTPLIRPMLEDDSIFPRTLLRQANTVLSYVSAVDQDSVTKVMSNEVVELIAQYREAGLESR